MPQYRVTGGPDGNAGLNYKNRRAEPNDVIDDLPRESIKWLREQGYIEAVGKDAPSDPVDVPVAAVEGVDAGITPTLTPNALEGDSTNVIDGGQ